jgi:hypothetical protein
VSRLRVVLVVGVVAACGPREDVTPQIVVQPGAAERAMALTGKMETGPTPKPAPTSSAPEPPVEGRLVFACMEPRGTLGALVRVPCVATVHRLDAPAGDAGEDDDDDDEVLAADGKIAMHLAPGKYHVTAARGLEHASAAFDVAITAGQTTWGPHEGAVTIARVVDTKQYFAADLAVHAFTGDDARASAREWIATEAARGIEVVAPAQGVAPFDLEDLVRERKLDGAIVALAPRDFGVLDLGALEPASRDAAIADYLARLAAKAPVTPVASGEARTYVRVDDDTATAAWDAVRDASFVRGVSELRDVVLTDGPFLRVAANGGGIGSVVRPRAGDVAVSVHVECVAGTHVDRVALLRARGGAGDSRAVTLAAMPSGAMGADVTLHVRAAKDDAFVVTARGETGEGSEGAFAMTGAIWIDADGDGESLGRKVGDIRPVTSEKTTP